MSEKEQELQAMQDYKKERKNLLYMVFDKKNKKFWKSIVLKIWKYFMELQKRKQRLNAYSKNLMYRRKMRILFGSWRGVSHQWFKERIDCETS